MSTLQMAHDEMQQRARSADQRGAIDRSLLEQLASVADYLRRIGDHDSKHYRAEKSGDLVDAALRTQRDALVLYGGEHLVDEWVNLVFDLHRALDHVVGQVSGAMWAAARSHYPYTWQADELRRAVADLCQQTNRLYERAVPDPDGWS